MFLRRNQISGKEWVSQRRPNTSEINEIKEKKHVECTSESLVYVIWTKNLHASKKGYEKFFW